MKGNALSSLGRMSYSAHFLFYPGFFVFYQFVIAPWRQRSAERAVQEEVDAMPVAKRVDPDLFSPFTIIPYHNNPELKYAYQHLNMKNYVNEHHINVNEYTWRGYHDAYDFNNQKAYLYNWTSITHPNK